MVHGTQGNFSWLWNVVVKTQLIHSQVKDGLTWLWVLIHPPTRNSVLLLFKSAVSSEHSKTLSEQFLTKITFNPQKIPIKFCLAKTYFQPQYFWPRTFVDPIFLAKKISPQISLANFFSDQKQFWPKFLLSPKNSNQDNFW